METTLIPFTRTYYRAKGYVYGLFWGDGEGSYPSTMVYSDTIEELRSRIREGIMNGSLDSGMGFQRLIGAIMEITILKDIIIDDKVYTNKTYETEFFGDLSEKQMEFLEGQMLPM